jgi:predicted transcriptional regulator
MSEGNGEILFKSKQTRILLSLRNNQQPWYISTLAKSSDATYVHTSNFLKKCEILGITTNEKHGKIKEIKLTEKGIQIANMLSNIYTIIKTQNAAKPEPPKDLQTEKTANRNHTDF